MALVLNVYQLVGYLLLFIICVVIYLWLQFGPGIDIRHAQSHFPLSESELNFIKTYVAAGSEITGVMERVRSRKQMVRIFYRIWIPNNIPSPNDAVAVVVYLHGLNSHSGRNDPMSRELLENNFIVAKLDHEGFGRSGGRHGYFESVNDLAEDVIAFITDIRSRYKGKKVFLEGISLGGLVALHVLTRMQNGLIDGAVLLCPAVQIHEATKTSVIVESIGKFLHRFFPKLPVIRAHRGRSTCAASAALVEAMIKMDPLFYSGRLRIGTGLAILAGIEYIRSRFHEIRLPYLLQHGTADLVCDISGSEKLHESTSSEDKTFLRYKGAAHDLCNDSPEIREAVARDIVEWLLTRA